jgi:hypothetical protein
MRTLGISPDALALVVPGPDGRAEIAPDHNPVRRRVIRLYDAISRVPVAVAAPARAARPRKRRERRHVARSTSSADGGSDDDPPAPPPPSLRLWRHPRFGPITPELLAVLFRVYRDEVAT